VRLRAGQRRNRLDLRLNLGLSEQTTVGPIGAANGWNFTTYAGDPICDCDNTPPSTVARHNVGGNARVHLTEVARVPPGFRFRDAKAVVTRVLYEARGRKELAAPEPFVSRPADQRRAKRKVRRLRTRVRLRRLGPARVAVDIRTRRRGLRVPRACHALPPSLRPRRTLVSLETRLRLTDGRRTVRRVIRRHWLCERGRYRDIVQQSGTPDAIASGMGCAAR
jgi:hypothetical protein